jgi:hypothetical protein
VHEGLVRVACLHFFLRDCGLTQTYQQTQDSQANKSHYPFHWCSPYHAAGETLCPFSLDPYAYPSQSRCCIMVNNKVSMFISV